MKGADDCKRCGSSALKFAVKGDGHAYGVMCTKCNNGGAMSKDPNEAIRLWNVMQRYTRNLNAYMNEQHR